jgi:hypothetical protein
MPRSESIVGRVFRVYGKMFSFSTWEEGLSVMLGAMLAVSIWVVIGAIGFYAYRSFLHFSWENYLALYMLISPFYWGMMAVFYDESVAQETIDKMRPARATETQTNSL